MVSGVVLVLALACSNPPSGSTSAEGPAPVPGWSERFALVRSDLEQLEAAHAAKDRDAAFASWEQAYRQRFEPLIEEPVGDRVDPRGVAVVEYAFGRLGHQLESPRPGPVKAALGAVREGLDALEPAVVALPPPVD
jgi:hypothetical protein